MSKTGSNAKTGKADALKALKKAEQERAALRFERGLFELENDRTQILENTEFTDKLGFHLYDQFTKGDKFRAEQVILLLFDYLERDISTDKIAPILNFVGNESAKGSNIHLMQFLCEKYHRIICLDKRLDFINDDLTRFLSSAGGYLVRSSQWDSFEKLVETLWKIRNITQKDGDTIRSPYKMIFKNIATKDVFEKILLLYKSGEAKQKKMATNVFTYFGDEASLYLLNRLVFSTTKDERLLLIQLIGTLGGEIIRLIQKFMQEDLPWYAIRNLIILIAEYGNPALYKHIEGYLVHPDQRVQQQVVACIIKLKGEELPKRLVQALPIVDDEVKMKLIMQLSTFNEEVIATGLLDVIHKRADYARSIREELLFKTCVTLRSYPYTQVVNVLKDFSRKLADTNDAFSKLGIAVEETINILEPQVRHRLKGKKADYDDVKIDGDPTENELTASSADEYIEEIDSMLEMGDLDKASAILYKKSVDFARAKEFSVAEMFRDKLLEVNPDALQDVIKLAEIIEEEKNSTSVAVKIDLWDDLFGKLTNSEYRYLMGCLRNENYMPEERIVSSGQVDPCLYLYNSGNARLSFQSGKNETFLKRINPGDVLGLNQFFSSSVWTVDLTAIQASQVQVLNRSVFNNDLKSFPHLEEKIFDYLKGRESINDLIKMSGRDRRDYARYPINFAVNNILLDPYGGSEGRKVFQGEMLDISKGGLSFTVRISSKESASLLLGRQIVSEIQLKKNGILKCFGLIVSVRIKHEIVKEYSVHVKFYKELDNSRVKEVLNIAT